MRQTHGGTNSSGAAVRCVTASARRPSGFSMTLWAIQRALSGNLPHDAVGREPSAPSGPWNMVSGRGPR